MIEIKPIKCPDCGSEETGDIEFKLPMVEPYTYYSLGMRKRAVKK